MGYLIKMQPEPELSPQNISHKRSNVEGPVYFDHIVLFGAGDISRLPGAMASSAKLNSHCVQIESGHHITGFNSSF